MPHTPQHRVILVDVTDHSRDVVARRLTAQGYAVEAFADPALGADAALASPPGAVVADLWMPSISGVQLCRLLRAEPATANVPVILRGQSDDPRSRFWAERAGAAAYVIKGRIRELVRTLAQAATSSTSSDEFFLQLSAGGDIRERIARHLDQALFDSVIAAEVRALASCGSFERLFDGFSQFLSQVVGYRWMAVSTEDGQFGLHHHPRDAGTAEPAARSLLQVPEHVHLLRIEDEDAHGDTPAAEPIVCTIPFGTQQLGKLAVAASVAGDEDSLGIVALVARELGGPLRMAALMDESQRLATTDPLTGLANRRALMAALRVEIAHARRHGTPLSFCLLDVDHFKKVNDVHGHAAGDQVLAAIGELLRGGLRIPDVPARWGGEEFVAVLKQTDEAGALVAAERLRKAAEALEIIANGKKIAVTVSIGVSEFRSEDALEALIDRADRAMYRAKSSGRNRVVLGSSSDAEAAPKPAPSDNAAQEVVPSSRRVAHSLAR
ncbi:MAG TPA: diguanylate cyclase [Polyangiaceae bacterium]|jgi:two-component system cell cycle response regulator|nr:diguanylate cyclase [Polyangiaceae bacterium]